jgi:hypothetical protein
LAGSYSFFTLYLQTSYLASATVFFLFSYLFIRTVLPLVYILKKMLIDFAYGLNYAFKFLKKGGEKMNTVIGIFTDKQQAEGAINNLELKGYDPKDISVIVKDTVPAGYSGSKGGSIAEGAASGAAAGGVLGGLAGLLIGLGAITIPGVGALLVAGPIAGALGLSGAAAALISGATTGLVAGGLLGGLVSLGIPDEEARVYEQRIREGAVLLAVPVNRPAELSDVQNIFSNYSADQIRVVGQIRRN